ncbi:MAG: 4-alpha-glucanotransferase [Anaerolineae bacterium]
MAGAAARSHRLWRLALSDALGVRRKPDADQSGYAGRGWLSSVGGSRRPPFPTQFVDYGWVIHYHTGMLNLAFANFEKLATPAQRSEFDAWCKDNDFWLDDYGLFMALKEEYEQRPWTEWDEDEALRDPKAMVDAQTRQAEHIEQVRFRQWLFARQWAALKAYANSKKIRLIGDIPIFVAHDSADVWANRELFYLDDGGNPTIIAGVPPDYFSETGQRWGNPLYKWTAMERDGYRWWIQRFRTTLRQVDLVRIDHFRGFEAFWAVPATEKTAIKGEWMPGPGLPFFNVIKAALGGLPIIAEDLGVITPPVEAMRDTLNLPGMIILQFAWGDLTGEARFLPHNHRPHSIVYTGTHDNNTTNGWWFTDEIDDVIRDHVARYLDRRIVEPNWELIRLAMMSVAHTAIIPLQDIFGLGEEARMNTPGKPSDNWTWRFTARMLQGPARGRLAAMTSLYARVPVEHNKPRPI